MLQGIGKRRGDRPETVLARMESCHARIRHFIALAGEMARGEHAEAEVRDAAASVCRYFGMGFLQHVRDEEDVLLPKLAVADLDAHVREEHTREDADVASLVALTEALSYDPTSSSLKSDLVALLSRLGPNMEAHLAYEEAHMFPLLAKLAPADERALFDAMEASREERRGQRS
jgi:iron-sulfur cluster repair protein YtfE (RIC family)